MRSKYRMGWLVVCFDLPVVEKKIFVESRVFYAAKLNICKVLRNL